MTHALRKGRAARANLTRDTRGEARIVEYTFAHGRSALTEAVTVISETLIVRQLEVRARQSCESPPS